MKQLCIDISHYQNVTSFHQVYDAGIRLVICKATQGLTGVDPKFHDFASRLDTMPEMLKGAYHFGTNADGRQQALHFLNVAKHKLLVLDWEGNGSSTMALEQAEDFVTAIHTATGKYPLLYGGALIKQMAVKIKPESPLRKCELWLAQYSTKPVLPKGWDTWRLWQNTDHFSVAGIEYPCDASMFPGTEEDLRRWYASL